MITNRASDLFHSAALGSPRPGPERALTGFHFGPTRSILGPPGGNVRNVARGRHDVRPATPAAERRDRTTTSASRALAIAAGPTAAHLLRHIRPPISAGFSGAAKIFAPAHNRAVNT